MARFLVTGGAGFIGSCLVRRWLETTDCTITTLDALTYAGNSASLCPWLDSPRHRLEVGDIRDRTVVRRILEEDRPDAVVHLAAESHVDRSIDGPSDFVDTNVAGTLNLLEAAAAGVGC